MIETGGTRQSPSVDPMGRRVAPLPLGVTLRDAVTHTDERGAVVEMFDLRWPEAVQGFSYSYCFTVRPGYIKGWGMHKEHDDRYFLLFGEMETVLYDDRPESPTYRMVAKVVLAERHRRLMTIPAGIWHANRCLGDRDAVIVNFPTKPYNHANPDKYVLPLNDPRIPYEFREPRGGA